MWGSVIMALAALQPLSLSSTPCNRQIGGGSGTFQPLSCSHRRSLALGLTSALLVRSPLASWARDEETSLVERVDTSNGYKFSYPSDWSESGKPVKTHLHELLLSGSGRLKVGITIDPVKIDSLEQFGTLAQTTDRVLDVERTRDGVKAVTLRANAAQVSEVEPTYYTIDYVTESSRGTKIFLCKYCIAQRRLYVLQAQCGAADYDADISVRTTLSEMVASFKVLA